MTVDLQNPSQLILAGTGTVSGTGFDNTPATWSWSGDTSGGGLFTWSSTVTAVPEPALPIVGLASLGMAMIYRRRGR